jgi:hypothetical protein
MQKKSVIIRGIRGSNQSREFNHGFHGWTRMQKKKKKIRVNPWNPWFQSERIQPRISRMDTDAEKEEKNRDNPWNPWFQSEKSTALSVNCKHCQLDFSTPLTMIGTMLETNARGNQGLS